MLCLRGVLLRWRGRDRPIGARLLLLLLPPVRVHFYQRRSVRGVQHAATPARGAGPAAAGPGAVVPAVATEWADVEVVPVAAIELAPVPVVVQPAAAEPSKFVMP